MSGRTISFTAEVYVNRDIYDALGRRLSDADVVDMIRHQINGSLPLAIVTRMEEEKDDSGKGPAF